jgi:hypothetical protein
MTRPAGMLPRITATYNRHDSVDDIVHYSFGAGAPGQTGTYRRDRQACCCARPLMAGGGLPIDATPVFSGRGSPVVGRRLAGGCVLTAENLITGSLADDDVAPWAGTTSGSTGRVEAGGGGIAAARPQEEGCTAEITRGFGGRRRDDTDLPPGHYRTDDWCNRPHLACPVRTPTACRNRVDAGGRPHQ